MDTPSTGTPAPAEGAVTPATQAAPEAGQATPVSGVEGATAPDSFTSIDPNQLPPELSGVYKSMQADYTRKMQEISPYRSLGDIEQVQQALQFTQALQSDPNFAVQVHNELATMLQQGGFLQNEGATPPVEHQPQADDLGGDFEEDNPLAKEIQTIKEWASRIEAERQESAYEAHLDKQEAFIRSQHPGYADDDMQAIYQLAFAYGGDLVQANQAYQAMQSRIVGSYAQTKGSVPAGLSSPPVSVGAQEPVHFESLNDPNLDRAVQAYLANLAAQGQ